MTNDEKLHQYYLDTSSEYRKMCAERQRLAKEIEKEWNYFGDYSLTNL